MVMSEFLVRMTLFKSIIKFYLSNASRVCELFFWFAIINETLPLITLVSGVN